MSVEATSILAGIITAQTTAILLLAVGLVRVREKLARLEQRFDDKVNGGH